MWMTRRTGLKTRRQAGQQREREPESRGWRWREEGRSKSKGGWPGERQKFENRKERQADECSQECCEKKRVSDPRWPQTRRSDSDAKASHVEVGQDGTNGSCSPNALGDAGAIKAGSNAQSGDGVGEARC